MRTSHLQHMISSGVIFLVSIWVAWISFTQEPAQVYLFPRLIAVFFIILAAWNFFRAIMGLSKVGEGLDKQSFINIIPGLLVMIIYVFFAAKTLGFYFASSLTFLCIYTLYDPAPLSDAKAWGKRILATVIFMSVIYALFALLLKVQTPRGIWF